jgi:diguanylate cyclase (GGDEF)-like protein
VTVAWAVFAVAGLVTSLVAMSGGLALSSTTLVVAGCLAVLVASPVWVTEGEERATLGVGEIALVVAFLRLEPTQLLLAMTGGQAVGWILGLPRRRRGHRLRIQPRRVQQGVLNVTTNVLGLLPAVWLYVAMEPAEGRERVVAAVACSALAMAATHALLVAAMALVRPIGYWRTFRIHGRPVLAVLGTSALLGSMIGLSGEVLGGPEVWLVLTTAGLALLSLAQTRRMRQSNYLSRVVEAAEQFTPALPADEVCRRLCELCQRALHAERVTIRDEPPGEGEVGLLLEVAEAWLVATGRRGFAGRFTANDERLLAGITGIAEVSLRNARLHDELEHLAIRDELTGLLSRRGLRELFEQVRASADRDGHRLVLAFLDVDRFKAVNDTYGHERGDLLIQEIAGRLREVARDSDLLCRLGGDEFVIVGEDRDGQTAIALHGRLRASFEHPFVAAGDIDVGASLGMAVYPDDADTLDRLLTASDAAMYADKQRRR